MKSLSTIFDSRIVLVSWRVTRPQILVTALEASEDVKLHSEYRAEEKFSYNLQEFALHCAARSRVIYLIVLHEA
jgi:hypothetical protein